MEDSSQSLIEKVVREKIASDEPMPAMDLEYDFNKLFIFNHAVNLMIQLLIGEVEAFIQKNTHLVVLFYLFIVCLDLHLEFYT
jgi:hypothetical protein